MISITYIAVRFFGGGAPAGRVILELNCRHLAVYLRIINMIYRIINLITSIYYDKRK